LIVKLAVRLPKGNRTYIGEINSFDRYVITGKAVKGLTELMFGTLGVASTVKGVAA
jgi:hypothetical protein